MVGIFQLKALTPQIEGLVKCLEIAYWTYTVVHQKGTCRFCKNISEYTSGRLYTCKSSIFASLHVVCYPRNISNRAFSPRNLWKKDISHWKILKIEAPTSTIELRISWDPPMEGWMSLYSRGVFWCWKLASLWGVQEPYKMKHFRISILVPIFPRCWQHLFQADAGPRGRCWLDLKVSFQFFSWIL